MKQEQKYYIIRKDRRNEEYADAPYLLGMQQRDAKVFNSLMEANSTACEIGGCDVECIGGSV